MNVLDQIYRRERQHIVLIKAYFWNVPLRWTFLGNSGGVKVGGGWWSSVNDKSNLHIQLVSYFLTDNLVKILNILIRLRIPSFSINITPNYCNKNRKNDCYERFSSKFNFTRSFKKILENISVNYSHTF